MPRIVQMNVFEQAAATPSNYQQMGACVCQGATTLAEGAYSLQTSASGIQSILAAALALTSLTWSGGTVTATTSAAIPGLTSGDEFITAIAGATPSGYNGTYLATVTGTNTFTFALASNPGTESVAGTYTPPSQQELIAMLDEFYTQGQSQAVYVLELGAGDGASGPTALSTWITDNPGIFYSYLVPRIWDGEENYITLVKAYTALTAMTYFFTTTTADNYALYKGIKSVCWFIEAPNANATLDSFDCASPFQMWLANNPGVGAPMASMGWRFSYGTTAWPESGDSAPPASWDPPTATNPLNYITTGDQGGIDENCFVNGYMADGNPMQYWYAADWLQVNLPLAIANSIINGVNDGNPVDYDQSGIDTEQDVAVSVLLSASAANLLNGAISQSDLSQTQFAANFNDGDYNGANVVNAVPFASYVALNPSTYKLQEYGGFSAAVTPMLGLQTIIFNLDLTQYA